MKIKKLKLKNFKRFTDLVINDIPETAKLVLLIGSNGSGKSSVFDAFEWVSRATKRGNYLGDTEYYLKRADESPSLDILFTNGETLSRTDKNSVSNNNLARKFYGRSSMRIMPRIARGGDLNAIQKDIDGPERFIDYDTRFNNDVYEYIQRIDNALREPVFKGKSADTVQIFEEFIKPFNESLLNIFGGDANTTIQISKFQNATSAENAKLIFTKGKSTINYDLLSHGEKQVVILLLNFIVRNSLHPDSIYFIDEMDAHLNTALQKSLIREITEKWIPENCQLWTATHALGFIDYAREYEKAIILDFDDLDFDYSQTIIPASKDRLDVYKIAIPKEILTKVLKGKKLIAVENKNAEYYNLALGEEECFFLPANNSRQVFLEAKGDKNITGLKDRDYLKDEEIDFIQKKFTNLKVLHLSTFENYIYHPDNLSELQLQGYNREEYVTEIKKQKNGRQIEIIAEIGTSRQHYIEFKEGVKNDENIKPIYEDIQSDDFDRFYKYFNMKKYFDKTIINKLNYKLKDLAKTKWFKKQIEDILKS